MLEAVDMADLGEVCVQIGVESCHWRRTGSWNEERLQLSD